ncbi:MAG: altronate dehydratase family protein [Synergistaceae bacterium]|nr:altronate dehydratase family protein [Synergistaceae bacterium]
MYEDRFIRLSVADNVLVLPGGGRVGDVVGNVTLRSEIPPGHKFAPKDIEANKPILKYGRTIGYAAREIKSGDWIHDHNVLAKSCFGTDSLRWNGPYPHDRGRSDVSFMGYRRKGNIRPGVRNELWVIPTTGCIKGEMRYILSHYHKPYWIGSVKLIDCIPVCEGSDTDITESMMLGLARNPNAAGVLLVGLGCEKPPLSELYDRALAEDCHVMYASLDKNSGGVVLKFLDDLAASSPRVRESFPISDLCVGIISARGGCSGITANPMLGMLSDRLAAKGSVVLAAGTPELFASGDAISDRITSRETYEAFISKAEMNAARDTPSMDEWENGTTTPEERAMSMTSVLGESSVTGFLNYGEATPMRAGVMITPGNRDETVNCTVYTASGAQIVLFATVRGTPFGSVSPTVKISADSELAEAHPDWIDFDSGPIINGEPLDAAAARLEEYILRVACDERTAHERKGFGDVVMPRL